MSDTNFANYSIKTHNTAVVRDAFKFAIGASGAVGTVSQGSGGFVSGVAKTATGRYTVTLNTPYPSSIIYVHPTLSISAVTAGTSKCAYKEGSYSASAGTFEITVSKPTDDTHATTQVAVDPENPSEIMVDLAFIE